MNNVPCWPYADSFKAGPYVIITPRQNLGPSPLRAVFNATVRKI